MLMNLFNLGGVDTVSLQCHSYPEVAPTKLYLDNNCSCELFREYAHPCRYTEKDP